MIDPKKSPVSTGRPWEGSNVALVDIEIAKRSAQNIAALLGHRTTRERRGARVADEGNPASAGPGSLYATTPPRSNVYNGGGPWLAVCGHRPSRVNSTAPYSASHN